MIDLKTYETLPVFQIIMHSVAVISVHSLLGNIVITTGAGITAMLLIVFRRMKYMSMRRIYSKMFRSIMMSSDAYHAVAIIEKEFPNRYDYLRSLTNEMQGTQYEVDQ